MFCAGKLLKDIFKRKIRSEPILENGPSVNIVNVRSSSRQHVTKHSCPLVPNIPLLPSVGIHATRGKSHSVQWVSALNL